MKDLIEFLIDKLDENWVKVVVAIGFTLLGWLVGSLRARRSWKRKEFYDRLNVSLNIIRDGQLQLRTILEKRCEEIFLNSSAAKAVMKAAQQTTQQDPLLTFPKDQYWYFLNAVLNEISEKFAAGSMLRDLGKPVHCELYVLCLTCEAVGMLRQR